VDPVSRQIVGTLRNMRTEVMNKGEVTPEADILWNHAMRLYRMRHNVRPLRPLHDQELLDIPMFLRRQAD
jgi:hypothetical protein